MIKTSSSIPANKTINRDPVTVRRGAYHITVFPSGLRVVTVQWPLKHSVSVGWLVNAGARFETPQEEGAAHCLEHMLFKGSRRFNHRRIKERIEGAGGSLNAYTSEEQTAYYAKVPAHVWEVCFDTLTDMVFHPTLPEEELEKEKSVICEEIKMYDDLPSSRVSDLLDGLLWRGHRLGRPLIGNHRSIRSMSRDHLLRFHHRFYRPPHLVAAFCGRLSHHAVLRVVEKRVPGLFRPNPVASHERDASNAPKPVSLRFAHENRSIEQIHLALGLPAFSYHDPQRHALNVLNIILGGNMSSRLFEEIRERRGLAYAVASHIKYFKDTGALIIRAGVPAASVCECIEQTVRVFEDLKSNAVGRSELRRAKDYVLGQLQLGLEDGLDHMLWAGESLLMYDRIRRLSDVLRLVERVGADDIRSVARRVLRLDQLCVAVVGPMNDRGADRLRRFLGV